jgi:predicted aspartyl protease
VIVNQRLSMDLRAVTGTFAGRFALAAALVLMSAGFGAPESSEPGSSPTTAPEVVPEVGTTKPDYEAATRPDKIGRIIVPVMVNGQGPFNFALDTGANTTVLTPHLAAALGLNVTEDVTVTMNGATGSAAVPTTSVERVAAGDVTLEKQQLPVADALIANIDGILGVDGLESKRIMVEFKKNRIEIRDARRERPIPWAKRIPAQMNFGRLIVVDATVDDVRVKAVVDTGSQYTLGNDALRAALKLPERLNSDATIDVLGETLAVQRGQRQRVRAIQVGDLRVSHLNVAFGDFYVFRLWELDTQPALVIGMDVIGLLDTLVIDYARQEVQFRARTVQFGFHPR